MAKVTLKKIDDAPGKALGEVRGYARKIWLAGLGAYTRVGQEGAEYLKELVKAGESVEKKGKKRLDHELDAANSELGYIVRKTVNGGTPVIVRPSDGAVIEGYRSASDLKAFLNVNPKSSGA